MSLCISVSLGQNAFRERLRDNARNVAKSNNNKRAKKFVNSKEVKIQDAVISRVFLHKVNFKQKT